MSRTAAIKGGRFATLILLPILLLAACGNEDDGPEITPTVVAPTQAAGGVDGDIASGCWAVVDRISTDTDSDSGRPAQSQQWSEPPAMVIDVNKTFLATVTTNKGAFRIEFYPEDAPQTVNNFICLARAGYYDNSPFHRILAGFVIQGGDPSGTGRGWPGYTFDDEPINKEYDPGTLAMANSGPDTNGSQFFIVLEGGKARLDKLYTIFGKVTEGIDVVNAIAQTPTKDGESGERLPNGEPMNLQKVTITELSQ